MAAPRVIQYVAGGKTKLPVVHLHCRVKPNASKVREGVTSVTDDAVELCVAAVPRDGESNKAVLAVLSEVSKEVVFSAFARYSSREIVGDVSTRPGQARSCSDIPS